MIQQVWKTQPQAVLAKTSIKQLTQPRNRATALLKHSYNFSSILIVFMQQKRKTEITGCFGEVFMLIFSHIYSLPFHTSHLIVTSNFLPVQGWFPGPLLLGFCHSVQFNCSVMSSSLQPHGLQHARPPCPSPIPGVYSNSCPLSQ